MPELRKLPATLNRHFGRASYPRNIIWFLTERCHLRCPFCFINQKTHEYRKELSAARSVEFIVGSGIQRVSFTGGEPLLYRGAYEVFEACIDSGIEIGISTTGFKGDELLEYLDKKEARIRLQVSLDGPAAVHNDIRRNKRAYDEALTLIVEGQDRGHDVAVVSTISSSNIESFDALLELATKQRFKLFLNFIRSSDQVVEGDCSDYQPEQKNDLSIEDMERCFKAWERYAEDVLPFKDRLIMRAKTRQVIHFNRTGRWSYSCAAGIDHAVVLPDGEVALCETLAPIGNLADSGDDWQRFWADRNEDLKSCFCQYDCAMIYSLTRSMKGLFHLASAFT